MRQVRVKNKKNMLNGFGERESRKYIRSKDIRNNQQYSNDSEILGRDFYPQIQEKGLRLGLTLTVPCQGQDQHHHRLSRLPEFIGNDRTKSTPTPLISLRPQLFRKI